MSDVIMERLQVLASHLCGNLFGHLELAPPDPILGTTLAYNKDQDSKKMNLGVGAYRCDKGKPYVFPSVLEAERRISADPTINKEYLPIDGLEKFNRLSRELLFGAQSQAVQQKRIVTSQAISGTGSLRVGAEFIATYLRVPAVYVSKPTWGPHVTIFQKTGLQVREYPYWCGKTKGLDFTGMTAALAGAPAGSVVLLHACAHNPTGVDPTQQQWQALAQLMQERQLIPYFDSAYQGFATGNIDGDAYGIRLFVERGFQCLVSQSYAKNFGLYGERIGALHIVCADEATAVKVLSQLKMVIRPSYSSPPMHGALLVTRILEDPALRRQWEAELSQVSQRIISMRAKLVEELRKLNVPGDWSHITKQIGMFSYTGLTTSQCQKLISKWHCYLLTNGRISMAGINSSNVAYLAQAIHDVVTN